MDEVITPEVIHEGYAGWYFWEETWADRQGPFPTREDAKAALLTYVTEWLDSPDWADGL